MIDKCVCYIDRVVRCVTRHVKPVRLLVRVAASAVPLPISIMSSIIGVWCVVLMAAHMAAVTATLLQVCIHITPGPHYTSNPTTAHISAKLLP